MQMRKRNDKDESESPLSCHRNSRSRGQTVKFDTLAEMAEMWKSLYAAGDIDRPFDRVKFDFLAKLLSGKAMGQQGENK